MDRQAVYRHQRARMHGAMVKAVASNGYDATTVAQIIGLAHVSRRTFYELYANKQECFLASFDLIVNQTARRIGDAYRACGGGLDQRLADTFVELERVMTSNWKSGSVIADAPAAGDAGLRHQLRAVTLFGQMLYSSFAATDEVATLPKPVARAIAGGLYETISNRLRESSVDEAPAWTRQMLAWTLGCRTATPFFGAGPAARGTRSAGTLAAVSHRSSGTASKEGQSAAAGERQRLIAQMLRLSAEGGFATLSPMEIADAAGLPGEAFLSCFDDVGECLIQALDGLSDELLRRTAVPGLVSDDWSVAVPRVLRDLMCFLADRPTYVKVIALEVGRADPVVRERYRSLSHQLGCLLIEGAPGDSGSALIGQLVGGALWHLVRFQALVGRIELLPALADHLAFVVLAPLAGGTAACEAIQAPAAPPGRADEAGPRETAPGRHGQAAAATSSR